MVLIRGDLDWLREMLLLVCLAFAVTVALHGSAVHSDHYGDDLVGARNSPSLGLDRRTS